MGTQIPRRTVNTVKGQPRSAVFITQATHNKLKQVSVDSGWSMAKIMERLVQEAEIEKRPYRRRKKGD